MRRPARYPQPAMAMDAAVGRAAEGFAARYGQPPPGELRFVLSPYRVCPLGAHVDHQDGVVTGMAIDHGVVVAFQSRPDTVVRAASANFPGDVAFDLRSVPPAALGDWGNFARGAAVALGRDHRLTRGVNVFLQGQLPIGGLSSSAAVGVGCLLALEAANELDVAPAENVRLARTIENDYIGLHSGVLDQSMILLAQADRLLRLDCRTGEREYVALGGRAASRDYPTAARQATHGHRTSFHDQRSPAEWGDSAEPSWQASTSAFVDIAVAYSGLSEALVGTGYNQRVAECREAAARLLALGGLCLPVEPPRLRDVPLDVYEEHKGALTEQAPALARRAAHFFGEQARVTAGTAAWARGDLAAFGRLVSESGRSSIVNYECGAPELVALYEALVEAPGVYGARFSGAGFRGACLALVAPDKFETVAGAVRTRYLALYPQYRDSFGFFRCASGCGARVARSVDVGAADAEGRA